MQETLIVQNLVKTFELSKKQQKIENRIEFCEKSERGYGRPLDKSVLIW